MRRISQTTGPYTAHVVGKQPRAYAHGAVCSWFGMKLDETPYPTNDEEHFAWTAGFLAKEEYRIKELSKQERGAPVVTERTPVPKNISGADETAN